MLIVICDAFDAKLPEKLAPLGEVTDDVSRLPEADVALIRSKTKATREWLETATNLKLIIRGGVGMDNIDRTCCQERGITATNTPKASSVAVAELAFALMLEAPNHLVAAHNGMVEGKFLKKELKRTELFGKTLGLVGFGNIAQEVAKRAQAFGMDVNFYDPYVETATLGTKKGTLQELVATADFISMHLPLTPETENLFNADLLMHCKDGVVVVNTGRGKTVDADAMVKALQSGKVAKYATDVWPSDPPPADYPILSAPNVLMAPHLGASTKENLARIGEEVCAIISNFKGAK